LFGDIDMLTLRQILNRIQTHKASLGKKYNIRIIAVFGSYVRQEQSSKSDIDVSIDGTGV